MSATINVRTLVDYWEVRDFSDGSMYRVAVEFNPASSHCSLPSLMVHFMGRIICFDPSRVEHWVRAATQAGREVYLLEDDSWTQRAERFVKVYLVNGEKLKARVEVKVKSKKVPVAKEYDLPFTLECPALG